MAAAAVVEDPTRHWVGQGGDLLLPSRWADSELKKITIDNDSEFQIQREAGALVFVV